MFLPLHISIICEIDDNCLLFVCWEVAIDHSHTVIVSLCFIVRMCLRFANAMLVVFIFFGLLFSCISTLFWWHELGIWIRYVSLDLFAFFMCIVWAYHTLMFCVSRAFCFYLSLLCSTFYFGILYLPLQWSSLGCRRDCLIFSIVLYYKEKNVDDSFGLLVGSCAHGKGELFDVFLVLYFLFCLLCLDLFCIHLL